MAVRESVYISPSLTTLHFFGFFLLPSNGEEKQKEKIQKSGKSVNLCLALSFTCRLFLIINIQKDRKGEDPDCSSNPVT